MPSERTRLYELMLIVTPEADDEGVEAAVQRTVGLIDARGGMVTEQERWGLRRLAYPINGYVEGHYALMRFACGATHTRELERNLIAAEDVLRHLITTVEREADLEALRADAAAAQAAAAASEQAEAVAVQDETEAPEQAEAIDQAAAEAPEQAEVAAVQDETEPPEQAEPAVEQDAPEDETPPSAQEDPPEQAEPAPTADEEPAAARPTA